MKRLEMRVDQFKIAAKMLKYELRTCAAIMTMKDGSRMTTRVESFYTPEGHVCVVLSNSVIFDFDTYEEFEQWFNKKFELCESEKDMYQKFLGLTDEDWEEWNK